MSRDQREVMWHVIHRHHSSGNMLWICHVISQDHVTQEPCDFISRSPLKVSFSFFSMWVFFHEHSRITGLQGKREGISLTPHYHFHPLHRHLDISQAITAESSPLHIASSRTRTGNLWFPSASRYPLSYAPLKPKVTRPKLRVQSYASKVTRPKFAGHRHCGSGDIVVLVCHVISPDRVTQGRSASRYINAQPILLPIDTVVVDM